MTNDKLYNGLGEQAKKEVDEIENKVNIGLRHYLILVATMIIIPLILIILKPNSESMPIWIQRSGSIIVVIALFMEIRLSKLQNLALPKEYSFLAMHIYLKNKFGKKLSIANYITHAFVIIGTIVWGYGDILFNV